MSDLRELLDAHNWSDYGISWFMGNLDTIKSDPALLAALCRELGGRLDTCDGFDDRWIIPAQPEVAK